MRRVAAASAVVAAVARAAARRSTPPQPWEKGELARPDDAVRPRPARREDHAAHLHEQGSGDRRLRRRRRRLWLQLTEAARPRARAPAPEPRAARSALLAAALALPGVLPRRARRSPRPTEGVFALQVPRLPRLAARRRPDDGAAPVVLHAGAAVATRWSSKASLVYDAMSGASPLLLQHAVGRVRSATTAPPATSSSRSTSAAVAVGVGGAVSSEQRLPVARRRRSTCALRRDDRNRTCAFGIAGTNDRINSINGVARQRAAQHARVPGRRHAGARRRTRSCSRTSPTTPATATTPTLQVARHAARPSGARSRGSRATTSTSSTRDGDAAARATGCCSIRSASTRTCSRRPGCRRCRGLERHAERALLHAERRRLLLQPAVPDRLRRRPALHGRHAAGGVRRVHRRRSRSRRSFADGWSADAAASSTTGSDPSWRLGGNGSPGISTFSARWFEVGFTKTF